MHNDRFEKLINHLRREALPPYPGNLEANVFRRIRLQGKRVESLDSHRFFPAFLRLKLGLAALALAIVTSAVTTAVAMDFAERSADRIPPVVEGMDLLQLELLNHSGDLICCCK